MKTITMLAFLFMQCLGAADFEPPEDFPILMTFKAFSGLNPGDAEFDALLEAHEGFHWIHSPGSLPAKTRAIRKRFPKAIITLQDAWGGSMSPDRIEQGWPGHWLYQPRTLLTQSISENETQVRVELPERILRNPASLKSQKTNLPFSVVIYALDASGRPDWSSAEYLIVEKMDGPVLTVQRGAWGRQPRAFEAGRAAVAAHMMFWSNQWQVNLSLDCPRGGPDNLTGAEWFARSIADRVKENRADGVEFDVARWTWGNPQLAAMDCDNDGEADYGYLKGVNSFGLGGQVFLRELRRLLGPEAIIQMDSNDALYGQRGWQYVNGAQLESFPGANSFDRFSEHFLQLRLWAENAEALPRYSYGFTKTPTTVFAGDRLPDGSPTDFRFRAGLAADLLVGMPHPFLSLNRTDFDPDDDVAGNAKTVEKPGAYRWDEYFGGEMNRPGWLGKPAGPARQDLSGMNADTDLLAGATFEWTLSPGYEAETRAADGAFDATAQRTPAGLPPAEMWFGARLCASPIAIEAGREYTLEFEARGEDRWEYAGQTFERVPRAIAIRGLFDYPESRPMSVQADSQWRPYRISFTAGSAAGKGLEFGVSEQAGATSIRGIHLFKGGAERWRREFENGLVLLNMTARPWRVELPAGEYRRLKGAQVPDINTGQPVDGPLDVPAMDAVILVKRGM